MYRNNFNSYGIFQQAYQIYSNALQYVVARETYINQSINKMEIEVKLRLQNLDKILTDYYQLYGEIEQEAARYVNYKLAQDNRIAKIEEEVKKVRHLLENKDKKIEKLEAEVNKLRILQKANESQILSMKQTKAESKEKTSFLTPSQSNTNDEHVNDLINGRQASIAKDESTLILLTQAEKTNDSADDLINSQKSTKTKTENVTKSFTQAQKTNVSDTNDCIHAKEQTKSKTKVGTRLLYQSQKNNDINMNNLRNTRGKIKVENRNSSRSSTQFEMTSTVNLNDFSNSECRNCKINNKNLVATKGKKWNNHSINTWLEQKLNLNVKDKAWKVTVFGEYRHIEFNASEYKQFLWQNRDTWEEEGIWSWFEC